MGDLFSGGAVGALMGEALKVALEKVKRGLEFKPTLERTTETFNSLDPVFDQIKQYHNELDRSVEEIQRLEIQFQSLETLIQASQELRRSSKFGLWKIFLFPRYQAKLQRVKDDLQEHLSVNVQLENKRDLMEILSVVRQVLEILLENFGQYQGYQLKGLRGAPEAPVCLEMKEHLHKLTIDLLKDGVSVLVLTGLAGSGKSTLAKKICWETPVKEKFGGNIFFVTVSKTPNLRTIVQTLFDYCGRNKVLEFQSDEDATNRLKVLLRNVGKNPILLVLDDVWEGSEALVEEFVIDIPDYKILVTSRVAFPRFGTACRLDILGHDRAVSLFRHYAKLDQNDSNSYTPDHELVDTIVKACKGSPLVLKVIGGSLGRRCCEVWQDMNERLQSQSSLVPRNTELLSHLQQSLDMLEDKFSINEKVCFMDLGLFPEDQRIPFAALIDMWAELYKLDENGRNAMTIVDDLTIRNLINLKVTRKVAKDTDMYYNNHFIMLHDLLRDLAIDQGKGEPFEQKERLSIELSGDKRPNWWVEQNQQGNLGWMFSYISGMFIEQKQLRVAARILSISTDETFSSDWCDLLPDVAEVLVINLHSSQYSLPKFTEKMSELKVLIVTNYGFHRSELNNFQLLGSLPNLKRIRLEKVSVPRLCILKNLRKLSLRMCNTKQAFEGSWRISDAMPNLVEMSIDYCNDLVKFPNGICDITPLKKLSITNCHNLSELPQEIAKLENLEALRLCSCTGLKEMPDSFRGLDNLTCFDIWDCINLAKLPDDIGELKKLKNLYLSKLSKLPSSVINFQRLEHTIYVICDEETASLWENFPHIPNLKIEIREVESDLNWLREA